MISFSLDDAKQIIEEIDKNLVRLQYDLAFYDLCCDSSGNPRPSFSDRFNGTRSVFVVDHVLLITIQDAVLAICRMFDNGSEAQSFSKLQTLRGRNKDQIIERAAGNYSDKYHDFDVSTLKEEYISKIEAAWENLGTKIKEVIDSKQLERVRSLRNDTIAHSLIVKKTNRPNVEDVLWLYKKMPELLDLSYRVFLDTDYGSNRVYEIAEADALHFWRQLIPKVKE